MDEKKKDTAASLLILSVLYFAAFGLVNTAGARDMDMLAVFEIDEYAQYPHLLRMVEPTGSIKLTIRNFLVYGHYYYGYPFYFFSGLVLLPFRLLFGIGLASYTRWIMLALRQLVNVLPGIAGAFSLTYFTTRFRSPWKSLTIFLLILLLPALVQNGFWWHPDGIGLMFVSLTFLLLSLDSLDFGWKFSLAAVATGIAAGIKYLGAFFILTIPAYLIFGIIRDKINIKHAVIKGSGFLVITAITLVLTNPLLLLPLERSELIATQISQFNRSLRGELLGRQPFLENGRLPGWLITNYGSIPFLVLLAGSLLWGLFQKKHRLHAILILSYISPLIIAIGVVSLRRTHYYLPIILPLIASLGFLLPDRLPRIPEKKAAGAGTLLIILLLAWQGGRFLLTDVRYFDNMLHREERSSSIAFYRNIQEEIFPVGPDEGSTTIYRDWHVYFPATENFQVFIDWDLANYSLIDERKPDYLLLERANMETYGSEEYLIAAPDPGRLAPMHEFYADALHDRIQDYDRIYADHFGFVFKRIEKQS